ncbi:hypothetical protein GGR42_001084 [Saonia flava]|uniref:Uncharacterized protein n=1 Tax=Saonia flava TaxID=523696 RepID=A0A846QVM1_9FLAO|nr:hypothetical protein [Saonia flava]
MLKGDNKYLWFFLIVIWFTFIVWENQVIKWVSYETSFIFRVDLFIILPILIAMTMYVLYIIVDQKKKNNS